MKTKLNLFLNVLLAGLLFSLHGPAMAQTWQVVHQKPAVTLFDLQILPDGMHGYATGNQGNLSVVYATDDGGNEWKSLLIPFATTARINAVHFVNQDTGWVAGYDGFIARTSDGGQTWVQQISGTNRKLYRIHFVSDAEGWITGGWNDGTSYLLLHTTDGGQNWQNMSFGSSAYSTEDVFFINQNTGWICGLDNQLYGHIHRTDDGGQTWIRQTIPNQTVTGVKITAVDFINSNKGWATVSSLYLNPAGPVLYTEDGGQNWVVQTSTGMAYNDCIDVRDSLHVAVVGVNILGNASQQLFTTADGGQNWNAATMPVTSYTYGVQYVGTKVWACLNYSQILMSGNSGANWSWQQYAPFLKDIAFSTPTVGWTVAGSNVQTDHWCYKTNDGGNTWDTDPLAPGGARVTFTGHNDGWMLYEGNAAKVFHTPDGGISWTQAAVGTSNWTGGMFFASQDSGWVYGSNGNLRFSSNGGASWAPQAVGSSNYVEAVFFVNSQEGWAGGGYGGGSGFISHTVNGGASWSLQTYPGSEHIMALFFLNNQQGWASAAGGKVYRTTNGGQSWTFAGQVNDFFAEELLFTDAHSGWMAANTDNNNGFKGKIYRTTNGGVTWTLDYSNPWNNSTIKALARQSDNTLWACGGHATILKYQITTGVELPEKHPAVNLHTWPNPASGMVNIALNTGSNETVELAVFDLHGKRVSTIHQGSLAPGNHVFRWDISLAGTDRPAPGLYLLRMITGETVATGKIILQ